MKYVLKVPGQQPRIYDFGQQSLIASKIRDWLMIDPMVVLDGIVIVIESDQGEKITVLTWAEFLKGYLNTMLNYEVDHEQRTHNQ